MAVNTSVTMTIFSRPVEKCDIGTVSLCLGISPLPSVIAGGWVRRADGAAGRCFDGCVDFPAIFVLRLHMAILLSPRAILRLDPSIVRTFRIRAGASPPTFV